MWGRVCMCTYDWASTHACARPSRWEGRVRGRMGVTGVAMLAIRPTKSMQKPQGPTRQQETVRRSPARVCIAADDEVLVAEQRHQVLQQHHVHLQAERAWQREERKSVRGCLPLNAQMQTLMISLRHHRERARRRKGKRHSS